MNEHEVDAAAKLLVAARVSGRPGPRLPESCRPADIASALAIQRRSRRIAGAAHRRLEMLAAAGSGPDQCAPILAPTIFRASPCAIAATGAIARIEPEVAFVMARRSASARARPIRRRTCALRSARRDWCWSSSARVMPTPAAVDWLEMMADCVQNQGLFVGPIVAGRPRCAVGRVPGHDPGCGGAVDARRPARRRSSAASSGLAREFPRGARTRACARGRSSRPARMRARSRFRWTRSSGDVRGLGA